ncbi:MAG: hypothetical protein IKM46_05930 [Clostridia bacterium]|nr:hypothetical protein [Clostridia bacterium]
MNQNKMVLTKDVIEKTLNQGSSKPKKTLGVFLCIAALFASEGAVFAFVCAEFVMGFVLLALGIYLWYTAVKKIREGVKNKENALGGQYMILQATCVGVKKDVFDDNETTLITYVTAFSNGDSIKTDYLLGSEGDVFYLVYLPDSGKANAVFNGRYYVPSGELFIVRQ